MRKTFIATVIFSMFCAGAIVACGGADDEQPDQTGQTAVQANANPQQLPQVVTVTPGAVGQAQAASKGHQQ